MKPKPLAFEIYYSAADVRELCFPRRSKRWVLQRFKDGDFGDLVRDGGGWLVPESGVLAYLERHRVGVCDPPPPVRPEQRANLKQFRRK